MRAVTVTNHNRLLSMVEGCVGLKTGYTDQAKRCLVSAVKRDGVTLIAVTLNGHEYWEDHKALYEAGFPLVKRVSLSAPVLPPLAVAGDGASETALCVAPAETVLPAEADAEDVTADIFREPFLFAPVNAGERVGTVTYQYKGRTVATAEITTKFAVAAAPPRSFWRRTADAFYMLLKSTVTFR